MWRCRNALPPIGSAKRGAGLHAERLENQCRRADAGVRSLDHVQPGKGRKQKEPGRDVVAEPKRDEHDEAGEGQHGAVESHLRLLQSSAAARQTSLGWFEMDFLELADAEGIERELLVEGLALPLPNLAQEVFL